MGKKRHCLERPARILLASLAASVLLVSCGGGGGGSSSGSANTSDNTSNVNFDRQTLLKNIGENLILPTYQAFQSNANALVTSVQNYCNALGGDTETTARIEAQNAWKTAMADWQMAEMTQFGPLADHGGQLRNNIYSWPLVNACNVDQDVIKAEAEGYNISTRTVDRRGLDALEYVLFSDNLNHTCSSELEGWNERTEADRKNARCQYALVAAQDIAAQATTLVQSWSVSGDNFLAQLTNAGNGSTTYASQQQAVNALSDAMFYLENEVKDEKLAKPAGIMGSNNRCSENPCAQDVESQYAHASKEHVLKNLEMFKAMFLGNFEGEAEGVGFDDYLKAANGESLAADMSNHIEQAITAVQNVNPDFADATASSPQSLKDAHQAVKAVTDDLKTQFLLLLNLDVPDQAAGDSD